MQSIFTVALPLLATVTTSTASLPFSSYKLQGPPPPVEEKPYSIIKEFEPETTAIREVAPPPKPKEKGNIRQESTFIPNICEGGSRTSWHNCGRGYGLIQWTSANRYYGLGEFAKKYGGSPSELHTQLRYLTTEVQWQRIEDRMKTPGKSIDRYMNYAYSWIGWGHHGARTSYAYEYASKLITVEV